MTDELGSVLAAAIGPALRRLDAQQPVDIAPGRRRLGDLPVTARSRRPHLLVALATVAALVLVLLVVTLPRGRAVEPVPALRSGLPTGLLVGHVLHRHEDVRPYRALVALRIRPDGGGALVFPLGDRSESFDVQYVGTGPGTVEVRSDSPLLRRPPRAGPDLHRTSGPRCRLGAAGPGAGGRLPVLAPGRRRADRRRAQPAGGPGGACRATSMMRLSLASPRPASTSRSSPASAVRPKGAPTPSRSASATA